MKLPSLASIAWNPAYRIIATRFPAVDLWAGLAPASMWGALDAVESLTNPRLAAGAEGLSYIHWPFDNPRPGRFSTDREGALYAAQEEGAAIAETVHHQAIRCTEDRLEPHDFDMRVLALRIEGSFHDIRGRRARAYPGVMDPDSHATSRPFSETLRAAGSHGLVFTSVRDPEQGSCIAVFTRQAVRSAKHLRYLTYRWDGTRVIPVFEKRPL